MPTDGGTKKTVLVAFGVALVCSIFVSAAAVGLKSLQDQNKKLDRISNILQAGDVDYADKNPEDIFNSKISSVVIELSSGKVLTEKEYTEEIKPENFNIKEISKNPEYTRRLTADKDLAGIKLVPEFMIVYQVKNEQGSIEKYILPIYGKGLWSTMYGFLALDKDLQTVKGITFYEHGETPGLGGEIDNPRWKKSWKGKIAFNDSGERIIEVIKGLVDPRDEAADHKIDGLSGATITTRGVDYTIAFWLGESGYGPYLNKLRMKEEAADEKI